MTVATTQAPPWLQSLDAAIARFAQDAVALKEQADDICAALSAITQQQALEAGYETPEELVAQRYAGVFARSEPKIVQPALRGSGFSQRQTALMCGVREQSVQQRERRQRQANKTPYSVGGEDQLPSPPDVETVAREMGIVVEGDPEIVDAEIVEEPEPQPEVGEVRQVDDGCPVEYGKDVKALKGVLKAYLMDCDPASAALITKALSYYLVRFRKIAEEKS